MNIMDYIPEKKIIRTHLYSSPFLFSIWLLITTMVVTNQLLDVFLVFIALIAFIYSVIQTRKGYIILETKNNELIIKNLSPLKRKVLIKDISHIKEDKSIFYIYLKNNNVIRYEAPSFLYSKTPLYGNHEHEIVLEKEIRQFFKEISDYLERQHEKEI